ncbi:MAG: DUF4294 domain-containing protein [Saprospiraceae bacterium]
MSKRIFIISIAIFMVSLNTFAQPKDSLNKVEKGVFDGEVVEFLITENGDTVILASLGEVAITHNLYSNRKEQYHHYRVKKRAVKVHKYAEDAIRIFNEVQNVTNNMKRRKRKKHIKRLQKELKSEFDAPLRKLSRYEGFVLMCMIERELDMPLYDLVKDLRGWWSANYWNSLASIYGYNIKDGYDPNRDPILENVLRDLKISNELAKKQ